MKYELLLHKRGKIHGCSSIVCKVKWSQLLTINTEIIQNHKETAPPRGTGYRDSILLTKQKVVLLVLAASVNRTEQQYNTMRWQLQDTCNIAVC